MAIGAVATVRTPATNSMADTFASLKGFFSSSTKFNVVANTSTADSFTLTPVASLTYSFHLNIRNDGTNILCALDPGSAITDAGDSTTAPTGSANMSGETSFALGSPDNVFYIIEVDDALFVCFKTSGANQYFTQILHAGLIFSPCWGSDPGIGIEGYGIMHGEPNISTSGTADSWFSVSSQTDKRQIKLGNSWYEKTSPGLNPSQGSHAGALNGGTLYVVRPFSLYVGDVSGTRDFHVGDMKYIVQTPGDIGAVLFPKVLYQTATDSWLAVFDSYSASNDYAVIPWQQGVAP